MTTTSPAIVVTAAGSSRRFAAAGITGPKWALPLGGRSMLERAIGSIAPLLAAGAQLHVVITREQLDALTPLMGGLPPVRVHFVDRATPPGQAIDAYAATTSLDPDAPLVIWNTDTILDHSVLTGPLPTRAWMLLSEQTGDHWSFAEIEGARVTRTAEKVRISPWATAGLYGFASVRQFRDAVIAEHHRLGVRGDSPEMYVAPLYNTVIANGEPVDAVIVDPGAVTCVGTPEELIAACRTRRWPLPEAMV